jgi:hypothetical protein
LGFGLWALGFKLYAFNIYLTLAADSHCIRRMLQKWNLPENGNGMKEGLSVAFDYHKDSFWKQSKPTPA